MNQMLGNLKCIRESQIAKIGAKSENVVLDTIIDYDEVLNMEDIIGLSGEIKFVDQFDAVPIETPGPIKFTFNRPNFRKKLVIY